MQPTTFGPMALDIKIFIDDAAEKEAARPAGVTKPPVPVKRYEPYLMTEAELRAEIEYTFPHHASVAYGSLHAHLRRQQIRRYS
jgi:hypothetical protein